MSDDCTHQPVRIFISYSRKDLSHLEALETHLSNLKRQTRIKVWTDQRLRPSTEWEPDLLGQLRSAEIVLLLVTPDLMASDFIHDVELKETLERHKSGAVKVVPVLVRPTDFEGHALARFQGLPRNFKPVSEWPGRDQAWVDVVKGVRELVEILRPNNAAREDKTSHAPAPESAAANITIKTAALEKVKEPENSPALTLLHISDLHFGQARGEGRVHFDQLKVVGELLKDARAMRDKLGSPDAILVTGDVAFSARPEQYQQADAWLKQLATAVGVTSDKVWLVPGNHDVDRTLATTPLNRKLIHTALRADPAALNDYLLHEHVAELASSIWPKLEPYATFARSFGAPALSAESPFWRCEIASPLGKLLLVGFNSCLLSLDRTDAKANLALSQAQLHRVLEPLLNHALTLALMHHPPEWLSDGGELLKELQKGPHLLFSGHIQAAGGGVLHGLGQGSRLRFDAGASHSSPDELGRHEYAWIRLSHDGLDWYPRVYSTKRNAFKADGVLLDDQQIHQRLEPGQLPKPLREWLELTHAGQERRVEKSTQPQDTTSSSMPGKEESSCKKKGGPAPQECPHRTCHDVLGEWIKQFSHSQVLRSDSHTRIDPDNSGSSVFAEIMSTQYWAPLPTSSMHREGHEMITVWIARHEVCRALFQCFIDDARQAVGRRPNGWNRPNERDKWEPADLVTLMLAQEFCRWLGETCRYLAKKGGPSHKFRLPAPTEYSGLANQTKANVDHGVLEAPQATSPTAARGETKANVNPGDLETRMEWSIPDAIIGSDLTSNVVNIGPEFRVSQLQAATGRGYKNLGFRLVLELTHVCSLPLRKS